MDDDAVVDARLLAAVDCDQPVSRRFDLGVADFDTTFEMENSEPERTKACKGKTRLTLSLKKSRARSSGDAATPSAKRPRQALQPTNGRFNSGKTNHSLRASGATEMFRAGVPRRSFRSAPDIVH